jgi:general secretion pathway protein E
LCEESGYKGRLPLAELVQCSDIFNHLVRQKACLKSLEEEARKTGFFSIKEAAQKVLEKGETTVEEVLKAVSFEVSP